MSKSREFLESQIEISELYHIYGDLLSERQKRFIELYYDDNLTLSEIAEQYDISRQAVHDAIKHGREGLLRFETTLGLYEMKEQGILVETPGHWRRKAIMILDEMDSSLTGPEGDTNERLRAQIASLRVLLEHVCEALSGSGELRKV
jgi:predicted DNA-binding protein YlxM (UPF0122 family)